MNAHLNIAMMRVFLLLIAIFALGVGRTAHSGEFEIGPWTAALMNSNPDPDGRLLVERNGEGSVVEISVSGIFANDETFRELSTVRTLERLRFSYFSNSNLLTSAGISALSKAPRLSEVSLQCNQHVPDSFYWALGRLRQIETLRFVATWPANPVASRPLTNLVGLKRIWISYADHFSAEHIETLILMRSLCDVKIQAQRVDERALARLFERATITNLEVKARNLNIVRTRGAADFR